jgi:hypothetical protein
VRDKLCVRLGGNTPLFLDPGFEFIGQQHLADGLMADALDVAQFDQLIGNQAQPFSTIRA